MKKIGVLGLMAALAVTGAVAFLPKGVMAAEDSDQTISQGVYIGDVDVSGMTQEEAKKAVEDGMSEAKAAKACLIGRNLFYFLPTYYFMSVLCYKNLNFPLC